MARDMLNRSNARPRLDRESQDIIWEPGFSRHETDDELAKEREAMWRTMWRAISMDRKVL